MSIVQDRDMLFALLAVQYAFVTNEELTSAMNVWAEDKKISLGDVFEQLGILRNEDRNVLEAFVSRSVEKQGADVGQALARWSTIGITGAEFLQSANPSGFKSTSAVLTPTSTTAPEGREAFLRALSSRSPKSIGHPSGVSRFRILRPLRKGGVGEILVAEDTELAREVAVKRIQSKYADSGEIRERFIREAEIAGTLEHPGIVPVYGLGVYGDDRPYYAMRLISGDTLQEAVDRFHRDPLSIEATSYRHGEVSVAFRDLIGRMIDVCQAINYAHSRGVLHRDLKPVNVMLGRFGETLVLDWGLAKLIGKSPVHAEAHEPAVQPRFATSQPTSMGSVLGTPKFMSPEQAAGKLDELRPESDVYGLGASLYYVLVGKTPFDDPGVDYLAILSAVQTGSFPSPRELNPRIDRSLEAICLKAMAHAPENRYLSAGKMAEDLERYLADESVEALKDTLWVKWARFSRKNPRTMNIAVAVISVLITLIFMLFAT